MSNHALVITSNHVHHDGEVQARVERAEISHDPADVAVVEHADEDGDVAQSRLSRGGGRWERGTARATF